MCFFVVAADVADVDVVAPSVTPDADAGADVKIKSNIASILANFIADLHRNDLVPLSNHFAMPIFSNGLHLSLALRNSIDGVVLLHFVVAVVVVDYDDDVDSV
mmetsp:Transcript_2934/g.3332  ORF Transcript_2934/g.3332 Transcript_2934/m.3332 type:complete len:103 (+) Transcript_2934:436-744(+)